MRQRPVLAVLAVLAVIAAACGGGSDDGGEAAPPSTVGGDASVDSAATATTTSAVPEPDGAIAVEVFGLDVSDLSAVTAPEAAPTAIEHLNAMMRDVVGSLIADDDVFDGMTVSEMVDDYPVLALDVLGARATSDGDAFGIIQAYGQVGAAAGYPDDVVEVELPSGNTLGFPVSPSAYFQVRAESAGQMLRVSELALGLIAEVRATQWGVVEGLEGSEGVENVAAQACLFEILAGSRGCSVRGLSDEVEAAVEALADPFAELDWRDFGLADDVDDDLELGPLCQAWDAALIHHGVSDELALALDVAVDDSFLDTRFLGRSECRRSWADLDEDPDPDPVPGERAVEQILAAAAAAAAGHDEINEAAYDTAGRSDVSRDYYVYENAESAATMDVLSDLVDAARASYRGVYDPETRAQIMLVAHAGGHAINLHAAQVHFHELLMAEGDEFIVCFEDDAQSCPPPAEELLELDFRNFIGRQYEEIDVELLDESLVCTIWNSELDRLGSDAGFRADYVISSLRELDQLTGGAADCADSTGDTADS